MQVTQHGKFGKVLPLCNTENDSPSKYLLLILTSFVGQTMINIFRRHKTSVLKLLKSIVYVWKWKNWRRNISKTFLNVPFVTTRLIPFRYINVIMGMLFAKIVTQNWRIVRFAEMTCSVMDQSEIWNLRKSSKSICVVLFCLTILKLWILNFLSRLFLAKKM